MRRALLIAVGVVVSLLACRTTQPAGTENAEPIQDPAQREASQLTPSEPPGPATPITEPDAGIPPSPGP